MKYLLAILAVFALSPTGGAETISEFEKKFDVVLSCGPDALAIVSAKKDFNALFDKPRWSVEQLADYVKLNQVKTIGLKLQTNMIEGDGVKTAQALFTRSGAHVTLYAYRKKEIVVVKDLEPKAKDGKPAETKAEEPKKE
jgi:hypothetical protein